MMNLNPHTVYHWQIEHQTVTGNSLVLDRFNGGREMSSKSVDPATVIRVSLLPQIAILPKHDILIDKANGDCFVKWFGRVIHKPTKNIVYYINCVQTLKFRVWVYTDGRVQVTPPEMEIYL